MARFLVLTCVLMLVSAALTEENSENPNNMNHNMNPDMNNMNPNMNHMNPNMNHMNPNNPNMNHMNPSNPNMNHMNPNNVQNMKPTGDAPKQHNHNATKSQDLPKTPEKPETPTTAGKN
ncbi:uncharacterized protein MAL13P1.336-like [Colias croceus]|uniref:uncharacterized protein MAL13P1.336-like n=1 Tax=Colias crocea TaxID=72248 RepID=UPI001E27D803|nr:uncharacterized protein MAL13P1.336-like [Colias croceus]